MAMEKLLELQKKLITFKKDWLNPHFKSKYLTLDNLLDTILPACNELWILIRHEMKDQIVITTISVGKDSITSEFPITDLGSPQKVWSAITYAKRYNLWMLLNIVTDDDDDWNKASEKKIERKEFTQENYDRFEKEYKKHLEKYPDAKSMLKMLDVQYIVSDEYKTKITDFYSKL